MQRLAQSLGQTRRCKCRRVTHLVVDRTPPYSRGCVRAHLDRRVQRVVVVDFFYNGESTKGATPTPSFCHQKAQWIPGASVVARRIRAARLETELRSPGLCLTRRRGNRGKQNAFQRGGGGPISFENFAGPSCGTQQQTRNESEHRERQLRGPLPHQGLLRPRGHPKVSGEEVNAWVGDGAPAKTLDGNSRPGRFRVVLTTREGRESTDV